MYFYIGSYIPSFNDQVKCRTRNNNKYVYTTTRAYDNVDQYTDTSHFDLTYTADYEHQHFDVH